MEQAFQRESLLNTRPILRAKSRSWHPAGPQAILRVGQNEGSLDVIRQECPPGKYGACLIRDDLDRHVVRRWLEPHGLVPEEFSPEGIDELIRRVGEGRFDWVVIPSQDWSLDPGSFHRLLVAVRDSDADLWAADSRELIGDKILIRLLEFDESLSKLGPINKLIPRFFPRRRDRPGGCRGGPQQSVPPGPILEFERQTRNHPEPNEPARLSIDVEASVATLDGVVYHLDDQRFAVILKLLLDAHPHRLSRAEMQQANALLNLESRIDRLIEKIKPVQLRNMVKSDSKGYRLDLSIS